MKKFLSAVMALVMVLALSSCASSQAKKCKDLVSKDINNLYMFVDGADITDKKVAFTDFSDKFDVVERDGKYYYATTVENLSAYDLKDVKSFFAESSDGYVKYAEGLKDVYIAALESEDGKEFTQIDLNGKPTYTMLLPDGKDVKGLENIYMLKKPVDFSVAVKENGKEVGRMTFDAFMKKTPVGDKKVPTAMYDGSFKYNFGDSTYEGKFLGIDYKTMLAKLENMGIKFSGEIKDVEFYGTPGMGDPGKNEQYKAFPDEDAYFGNVEFFCMYDGMTKNAEISDVDMGLSAFINGSGQKWVTYNLTEINFVTE